MVLGAWIDSLPDTSREEAFFASSNSFSLLVAMEASSVFRCKTLIKRQKK